MTQASQDDETDFDIAYAAAETFLRELERTSTFKHNGLQGSVQIAIHALKANVDAMDGKPTDFPVGLAQGMASVMVGNGMSPGAVRKVLKSQDALIMDVVRRLDAAQKGAAARKAMN